MMNQFPGTPGGEGQTAERRQPLQAITSSIFYVSWPFFILTLLLPVYGKEIGASIVEIGLLFSVFTLMLVLLRPVIGWGLDRFGRKPFFLAGLTGYALTMFGFAFVNQVWGLMAARAVQGVASACMWLAAYAVVADVSGVGQRGRTFGRVVQANSRGSIVGALVGFAVFSAGLQIVAPGFEISSWQVLFFTYGGLSLLALWLAWRKLPETNPVNRDYPSRPVRWTRAWVLLLTVTLITGASWAMVSPVLIIFLQVKLQVDLDVLAWAFLPSGLVWAFLPAYLGHLADRFGRKPLMVLGLVMAAVSSFVIPYLSSVVALAGLWALQALCYAAGDPAEQALVADLTGGDQRGRAYGLYAMAADLGATIGPFGGTWLYQAIGEAAPFQANGLILLACAGLILALLKVPVRQHHPATAD